MVGRSLVAGLRAARREWRLSFILWACHLPLALVVAVPFGSWWQGALGKAIGAVTMLRGMDLSVWLDVLEQDGNAAAVTALAAALVCLVGALASAAVAGGLLWSLMPAAGVLPAGRALPRFAEGAGRYFWRCLRLSLLHGAVVLVVAGLAYAVGRAATAGFEDAATEGGAFARLLVPMALATAAWLVLSLVHDFARIEVVAGDVRAVRGAWWRAAARVVRRLPGPVALWAAVTLLVLAALAVYQAVHGVAVPVSAGTLALLIVAQQLFMLWRAAMRVTLAAGQVAQAEVLGLPALLPPAVPPSVHVVVPEPDAPAPPSPELPVEDLPGGDAAPATVETGATPAAVPTDDPDVADTRPSGEPPRE